MRLSSIIIVWLIVSTPKVLAMDSPEQPNDGEESSPWLAVPLISSDPKVGTSAGALAGYLFKLDPESTSSMVGVGGTYSTTDSYAGGLFLRSFWDGDSKRLSAFGGGGSIKNDYEDFLGSGLPAQTTDNLKIAIVQYLQQVRGPWFVGIKGMYTNYLINSEDPGINLGLDILGLTGIDSVALGLIGMYDSRDHQNTPSAGLQFQLSNSAYRESLGGEENFDVYTLKLNHYLPHGDGNVLAYRIKSRVTSDASPGGYSSIGLRGYTRGQYLAPHVFELEVEERWHLAGRFGINVFAGVACLFGDGLQCDNGDNLYPSVGVGGQYIINVQERIAMTFDVALGKSGNNGLYMRFGQAF